MAAAVNDVSDRLGTWQLWPRKPTPSREHRVCVADELCCPGESRGCGPACAARAFQGRARRWRRLDLKNG